MYPVWEKSMRNFFSPRSSSSRTFCFSSCRLPTMSWPSTSTTTTSPSFLIEKLMSYSPGGLGLGHCRLRRGLECRNGRHIDYVIHRRAAREIATRPPKPLNDRAHGASTRQSLHQLVGDISGIERGEHENVSSAGDGAVRRLAHRDG